MKSLRRFVTFIIEVFRDGYLRTPNDTDTNQLLALGDERGFSGILGSLDCMHWTWKHCPSAYQG